MGFEVFGAACPHCGEHKIWSKIEPNSMGAFQFDACLSCGFIELETSQVRSREETTKEVRIEAWTMLINAWGMKSFEELQGEFKANQNVDADPPLAFSYEENDPYINECVVEPEVINKAVK